MKRTDIYERGLDSVSVWGGVPTFLVGELDLTAYTAKVNLLSTELYNLGQCELDLLNARLGRDSLARPLRALCTDGCRAFAGTAAIGDTIAVTVREVYRIDARSFVGVKQKAEKLELVWKGVNTHRAALSPAQPALLVGTKAVTALQSDIANYTQLLLSVSEKERLLSHQREEVVNITALVDRLNKRFYKAWLGHWPAGSPERATLGIIDTGSASPVPGPAVFLSNTVYPDRKVRLTFGASRALTFKLLHKAPGQPEYATLADNIATPFYEHLNAPVGDNHYVVVPRNNAGEGTPSAVLAVDVPAQAVA